MKKEKTIKNRMMIVMAVVCIVSVMGMLAALTMGRRQEQAVFSPPPFDDAAQVGVPNVPEDLAWQEFDAKIFRASVCGEVIIRDGKADIWLCNPQDNSVWLKLRMMNGEGEIIGETGLIRPGEYVRSIELKSVPAQGSGILMKLMAYEPDTYYSAGSATLNTKIKTAENY